MAQALAVAQSGEAAATVASYFEVHVRRNERWMIDCTAHNADDALALAEEIARKTDVTAVKVINERYNPVTDQSATRVIFNVEKRRRQQRHDGPRLMAQPKLRSTPPSTVPTASIPKRSDGPIAADRDTLSPFAADAAARTRALSPSLEQASGEPAPLQLFAWASIALAVAATLLFIVLLFIT